MSRAHLVKPVLFVLLGCNAVVYAVAGRGTEMLDALAWFALLLLFELETRCPRWTGVARNAIALDLLRLIAASAVVWAAVAFVREDEWLDAANAWLWIGVVAVLELEVRAPVWVARHRRSAITVSVALYGALALVAAAWFTQGEWFDGYDAVLWIAAFALLELDLLRRHSGARSPPEDKL